MMRTTLRIFVWPGLVVVAMLALSAEPVLACPVCFGASDAPAAQGMNLAIFTLLGVTGSVLASFAGFIVYLLKRANAFRTGEEWQAPVVDQRV